MFRIFIVLVLIIGASSGVLFTNAYLSFQQSKTNLIERDKVLLRDIKNQLIQSVVKDESAGLLMLPYGVNEGEYHILPNWLFLPRTNPFGNNYIYCPFGETTGAYNQSVNINASNQYQVGLTNNDSTNGNNYVLFSEQSIAPNVLGVIISNHDNQNKIDCSDIDYDNNYFYGTNSLVEVIYKDAVLYNSLIKESYFNVYTEEEMSSTMAVISNRINDKTTLNLMNDLVITGYTFDNDYKSRKSILITSDNKVIHALTPPESPINLIFNNMDVYIENTTLASNVRLVLNDSSLYLVNANVSKLRSENSDILFKDTIISSYGEDIHFSNSEIIINNKMDWNFISSEMWFLNSEVKISDSDFNITMHESDLMPTGRANAFNLLGSDKTINNSSLNYSANANQRFLSYDLNSRVNEYNSRISSNSILSDSIIGNGSYSSYGGEYRFPNSNYVFNGLKGSMFYLNNMNLGANGGIADSGIALLSGSNNTFNADICVFGELGEDGRLLEDDLEYAYIPEGNYNVLGSNVFLQEQVGEIRLEIDISHIFSDIEINCIN